MAVDFYLKLDGIEGEAKTEGFDKQIQLLSFSWGGSQASSVAGTGGSGAGRADLSDLSIMKHMDKATSPIFKALVSGQHIKTGSLSATKAGGNGKPFLKLSFEELFVTSQQISASSEIPTESVSFSYNKIKEEYWTQDEKGTLTATAAVTFELKLNKVT
jgi:type VI secretion system secreted protein Hcp